MLRATGLALVLIAGAAIATDRNIVVPKDEKPFKCKLSDIVRISGSTPSGGTIEGKVNGPAKVENVNTVTEKVGNQPVIGSMVKEWELKPSGKGKVTVTITSTSPGSKDKKETKYEFEVE